MMYVNAAALLVVGDVLAFSRALMAQEPDSQVLSPPQCWLALAQPLVLVLLKMRLSVSPLLISVITQGLAAETR